MGKRDSYPSDNHGARPGKGKNMCGSKSDKPTFQKVIPKFLQKYSDQLEDKDFKKKALQEEEKYQKSLVEKQQFEESNPYSGYVIDEDDMDALKNATIVEDVDVSKLGKRKLDSETKFQNLMSNKKTISSTLGLINKPNKQSSAEDALQVRQVEKKKKKKKKLNNKKLLSFMQDEGDDE